MKNVNVLPFLFAIPLLAASPWEDARDRQDRAALEKLIASAEEKKPADADGLYRLALGYSYLAEVTQQVRDKAAVERAAKSGFRIAERAVAMKPGVAEYHRLLGTLYGQIIPVNPLAGFTYAKRSQDEITKAIELDPKSSAAYTARGIGYYYLPPGFGGGVELAIKDFEKAIGLNPKSDEAHMWLGIALRKANRNADSRKALARAVELNPNRVFARQQLEKTPAN